MAKSEDAFLVDPDRLTAATRSPAAFRDAERRAGTPDPSTDGAVRSVLGVLAVLEPDGDEEDRSDVADWFVDFRGAGAPIT